MTRRTVGYWQHQYAGLAIWIFANGSDDRARPIFLAFIAALEMLAMPKVTVANNQAGGRFRKRHTRSLEIGVEVGEFFRHRCIA